MNSPLIIALDVPDRRAALNLADQLDPARCRLKVGLELFVAEGPAVVEVLQAAGFEIFLDLKFNDIPNTVAGACAVAADLDVWMLNVHASAGRHAMEAAANALRARHTRCHLVAVTVLTSMAVVDLEQIGTGGAVETQVMRLAMLARDCGLDGVVCSPQETAALRQELGNSFLLVTPGVRPADADLDDQSRVASPEQALRMGADYLVIGRPVTRADSPAQALARIAAQLRRDAGSGAA